MNTEATPDFVKKDADANKQMPAPETKNTNFDAMNSPIENDLPF